MLALCVVGVDAMNDEFTEEKLKGIERYHKTLMNDISKLCEKEDFSLLQLMRIKSKLSETIEQLEFWGERDNSQRFYEELKSHVKWILKNYSQELKKLE